MFGFYLDNTLVDNPVNWLDFTETIEFDEILKALLPKYENKLTFSGNGYAYLYSQFQANGYCKLVQLKVDYQCDSNSGYSTILNGFIFISDVKFNLNRCTVECDVMDNNYGAKIFNNKNIKAYLNVGRSKNDVTISSCAYDSVEMFYKDGTYSAVTRRCYIISDAFRFLIDFMTDGDVGFESVFLTTLVDAFSVDGLTITTGKEIRLHDQSTAPFISFQELFHEMDIKYNLMFTLIQVAGVPTIKIEQASFFQDDASPSITIPNIDNLQQSVNSYLLYSKIKFGSTFLDYDGFQYTYPQIRFFNFADEEYHLQGKCNIDRTLDLTGFIISDTNLIEGCFETDTDNDTYDNELFFIQESSQLASQSPDPITNVAPWFYNKNLQNNEIAGRYNLQGNIALYLGNGNDTFKASNTIQQDMDTEFANFPTGVSISSNIAFQNDSTGGNYDTNGNYNNVTNRFVSPANGAYTLESTLYVEISGDNTGPYIGVVFKVYDASNVLQSVQLGVQQNVDTGNGSTFINATLFGSKTVYLPAGWYVTVGVRSQTAILQYFTFQIIVGSYFSCTQSENGGGVYQADSASDYFVSRFEFDVPVSNDDYVLMKADLSKAVIINNDGQTNRTTWIRKTIRKLATSETKWEMISSINKSQ